MEEKEKKEKIFTKELARTVLIVSLLVIIVRFFVIQPFVVKGNSMEPNFHDNEYIFVEEISARFLSINRGDVVIFKHPESQCDAFISKSFINRIFLQGPCTNFIKRVIGLPGETVTIKDGAITIKNEKNPDGFKLNESYVPQTESYKLKGDISRTLSKDEYFVLGDNRQPNASLDSREWGALTKDHITGKAWVKILPINEFGLIRNPEY